MRNGYIYALRGGTAILALAVATLLAAQPLLGQPQHPVPFISQPLVPASVAPGGPGFTLTVNGAGFVTGSVVHWNRAARATTFISSTRIYAQVPASDIAVNGTAGVTVVNSAPGGGLSNVAYLQVTDATPSVPFDAAASVGSWPYSDEGLSVTTGDFNKDGVVDLAAVLHFSDSISVLLGKGDGTFAPPVSYPVGHGPCSLISADFNGDRNPDLAVANCNGNGISLLLGNGDGTFQPAVQLGFGKTATSLVAADFNGDGKLDLAATNGTSGNVEVALGNGDGTFRTATSYWIGYGLPISVTTADFNNDGELDLAVADEYLSTVSVLLGKGDGTFQPARQFSTGAHPGSVLAADLNGDGNPDLVTSNFNCYKGSCGPSNMFSVFLGNGDGTFRALASYDTGARGGAVSVGDFNGDGRVDLVCNALPDGGVYLLLGNGDGTFQAPLAFSVGGAGVSSVASGDFNGDGRLDVAALLYRGAAGPALFVLLQPSPFLTVSIDVKPGDPNNTINLKSGGVVPVAILGSATFDPTKVDPTTVTFAGAHVATRGRGQLMTSVVDANHDGYLDLLLFFRTQDLQLTTASTEAVLYGQTYSGQLIRGSDSVRVIRPPAADAPGHKAKVYTVE